MSLIVETHVSHPDLLLAHTIGTVPSATIRIEPYPITDREEPLLFLRVETDDPGTFEHALAEDPTVADPLFVLGTATRRLYRVRVTEAPLLLSPKVAALSGRVVETRSGNGGWYTRIDIPDREPIREFHRFCAERGVRFTVNRLYHADDLGTPTHDLTDEQAETLLTAYAGGYFDIPRRMNGEGLAAVLGISDSAASQRIRRATAALIESTLAPDRSD